MNERQQTVAKTCLAAAENDTMAFPQIVRTLTDAGFESYAMDFRRATATYFLAEGQSLELPAHRAGVPIAPTFDALQMTSAIREAQQQLAGYTYKGFCEKAVAAGCAFYVVSLLGRRALYVGRTGETHVERFPDR